MKTTLSSCFLFSSLLVLLIFSKTSIAQAQYTFGDVEVASFEKLFNPENRKLWHKKDKRNNHDFKVTISDIWTEESYSRLLIKNNGKSSATFVTKKEHNERFWNKNVVQSLNDQFGKSRKATIVDPFVISESWISRSKWTHTENGRNYEIYFGDFAGLTGLLIYQLPNK